MPAFEDFGDILNPWKLQKTFVFRDGPFDIRLSLGGGGGGLGFLLCDKLFFSLFSHNRLFFQKYTATSIFISLKK